MIRDEVVMVWRDLTGLNKEAQYTADPRTTT